MKIIWKYFLKSKNLQNKNTVFFSTIKNFSKEIDSLIGITNFFQTRTHTRSIHVRPLYRHATVSQLESVWNVEHFIKQPKFTMNLLFENSIFYFLKTKTFEKKILDHLKLKKKAATWN